VFGAIHGEFVVPNSQKNGRCLCDYDAIGTACGVGDLVRVILPVLGIEPPDKFVSSW